MTDKLEVHLVQKNEKTGRIVKNEKYEVIRFVELMINGKIEMQPKWWHKLVPKSYKHELKVALAGKMVNQILLLIAQDTKGRKKR